MIDADLIYVGVDVSKANLDICVGVMGNLSTLKNDGTGHDALCRMLKPLKVGLVVLEATGGYELACAAALQSHRRARFSASGTGMGRPARCSTSG